MRRFDVVHVHFMHDWGLTPELAAEGCLMITPWGSDIVLPPGEEPPSPAQMMLRRSLLAAAAGVTACGPWFAGVIADFADLAPEAVRVIPFGVDTRWFRPPHSCDRSTGPGVRVGFFKGFRPVYGPSFLLRAVPSVLVALPDTRFDLVGDGPDLFDCRRIAALLEIEHAVHFFPRQPHRNIRNYLMGWDLSVIPSLQESFGVAALESSAVAVPVVASRVGGLVDTCLLYTSTMFWKPDILERTVEWLSEHRYKVYRFDCQCWQSVNDAVVELGATLEFPDWYGHNLDAFNDCLGSMKVPADGGAAIVLLRYDRFAERDRATAQVILDICADKGRLHMLFGERLATLVQSDDPRLDFDPVGSTPVMWNRREWSNKCRGL